MDQSIKDELTKRVKAESAEYKDLPDYEKRVEEHVELLEKFFGELSPKNCTEEEKELLSNMEVREFLKKSFTENRTKKRGHCIEYGSMGCGMSTSQFITKVDNGEFFKIVKKNQEE